MSLTNEINAISDRVLALEQENELLKQQLTDTKAFDKLIDLLSQKLERQDKLIDLLEEDILWQEAHLTERTSQKMKDIIAAYRAVRPK